MSQFYEITDFECDYLNLPDFSNWTNLRNNNIDNKNVIEITISSIIIPIQDFCGEYQQCSSENILDQYESSRFNLHILEPYWSTAKIQQKLGRIKYPDHFHFFEPYLPINNIQQDLATSYHSFALYPQEYQPSGTINMSRIQTITIPTGGNFFTSTPPFSVTLSPININSTKKDDDFRFVDSIGCNLMKPITVEIDSQVVDRHYDEWLSIWTQLVCAAGSLSAPISDKITDETSNYEIHNNEIDIKI